MAESKLSLNNVRVHLSQIPEFFSKPLKTFLTRQYDFNDEISTQLSASKEAISVLQQELAQAKRQLQDQTRSLTGMSERLTQLEAKNGTD